MAVTESREVVIEATPDEIMDVLFDLESLTEWSSAHQKVEILERDDQGRPSKSRQVVKTVGVSDEQVLAYTVLDDRELDTGQRQTTTRAGRPLHASRFLQPSKNWLARSLNYDAAQYPSQRFGQTAAP